jgi:hypothetical protein
MIAVRSRFALASVTLFFAVLVLAAGARAAAPAPIKEIETSHFGWEVNKTTKGDICTVESGQECQPGTLSSKPGGFVYPVSVAGAANGNIYVLEALANRVQELEPDGKFVLMFGKGVNKKGGDLCTAGEEGECQAGVEGTAPGQFSEDSQSIAVDPNSGDVYVAGNERGKSRVQEFTATGVFVLEIGREVNETKDKEAGATPAEKNVCTEEEIKNSNVKCTVPVGGSTPEPGAFNFFPGDNDILAVGGPEDLLYVGDKHRVQEFDAKTGHYKSEILLTANPSEGPGTNVRRLALDNNTGDLYLVYSEVVMEFIPFGDPALIREFDTTGKEVAAFRTESVSALAVNSTGLLAVSEENRSGAYTGALYEVGASLHLISQFASHGAFDLAFNDKNELYAGFGSEVSFNPAKQEVIAYRPMSIGALFATLGNCATAGVHETDVALDCTLTGEVDPWGVSETQVWFQWGANEALENKTEPPIPVNSTLGEGEEETPALVSAAIDGLRPDEKVYDELAGEDRNVKAPETMTSAEQSFTTATVPPRIVGEPVVAFATPSSMVLYGQVNPENAPTRYAIQYAPAAACAELGGSCAGRLESSPLSSSGYGPQPVAEEATGLRPATLYRYRLVAVNEAGETAVDENGGAQLPEGEFETAPARVVTAQTGGASQVGTTSAVVSGSVDPDGQPSTYAFEMGVYNGGNTRFGVVYSAAAGSEAAEETLALTGLQPGTTYAYRITIYSGDGSLSGSSATGAAMTFTTAGLPAALSSPASLALLSTPAIVFPKEPAKESAPKKLTRAQQLANALKACKKKPSAKRPACKQAAHKKYGAKSKKK